MTIICRVCKYENDDDVEFCTACGTELSSQPETPVVIHLDPDPEPVPPPSEKNPSEEDPFDGILDPPELSTDNSSKTREPNSSKKTESQRITAETARLILSAPSSLSKEFPIERSCAMVGRFDPDSGPVDINLDELTDGNTVSRNHAEIYREDGQWKVKDLGSENGTFIRRSGQPHFSSRIMKPEILNPDDEIAFGNVKFIFKSP